MFTRPCSVSSPNCRNGTSGVSSKPVSDIGLGKAAFGELPMNVSGADRFLRLRCDDFRHDKLLASSCRARGSAPSCGARHFEQTVAHQVGHVFPHL
jgi:hypothetical protein